MHKFSRRNTTQNKTQMAKYKAIEICEINNELC